MPLNRGVGRRQKANAGGVRRVACLCAVLVFVLGAKTVWSAGPNLVLREDGIVTNGTVFAIAPTSTTIYLGGHFTYAGPYTGGGVPVNATSGAVISPFPRVKGAVRAAVSDGAGGWFIGGDFNKVGTVTRNNIAHILANGTVGAWNPNADGTVRTIALSGSIIYAGGDFNAIGGQARLKIAAINITTGEATAWNPNATAQAGDHVEAIAVAGSIVYAGGKFENLGGQARKNIAALNVTTGLATAWNPQALSPVGAIVVAGSVIYAAGNFAGRDAVAALDAASGATTSWNPNVVYQGGSASVNAIAVLGSTVYLGGNFTHVGGVFRASIAAVNNTTGAVLSWNAPSIGGSVLALHASGSTVYAGGTFTSLGATNEHQRGLLAAFNATTGALLPWNPNAAVGNVPGVFCLAGSGSAIYVGGSFNSVGGAVRTNLAAYNTATGALTGWNPMVADEEQYTVDALTVAAGNVFIGGDFVTVGGVQRQGLVIVNAVTGADTGLSPLLTGSHSNVTRMESAAGTVFISGPFTAVGGQTRRAIAALDAASGAVKSWNPNPNTAATILGLGGTSLYVTGTFSTIGGQSRDGLAAINTATGLATAWNPGKQSTQHFSDAAVIGSVVYAGGYQDLQFPLLATGGFIQATNASNGSAISWDPAISGNSNNRVYQLAAFDSSLIVGGNFWSIGGGARNSLAALDASTAAVSDWAPNPNTGVQAIAVLGKSVYIGGDFTQLNDDPRHYFAEFSVPQAGVDGDWVCYP